MGPQQILLLGLGLLILIDYGQGISKIKEESLVDGPNTDVFADGLHKITSRSIHGKNHKKRNCRCKTAATGNGSEKTACQYDAGQTNQCMKICKNPRKCKSKQPKPQHPSNPL